MEKDNTVTYDCLTLKSFLKNSNREKKGQEKYVTEADCLFEGDNFFPY